MKLKEELVEKARCHPLGADAVLALVLFVLAVFVPNDHVTPSTGPWTVYAVEAVVFLALVFRRRRPIPVFLVVVVGSAVVISMQEGKSLVLTAAFLSICTVAYYAADRKTILMAWLSSGLILGAGSAIGIGSVVRFENVSAFAWSGFAAAMGAAVRSRQEWFAEVEQRAIRCRGDPRGGGPADVSSPSACASPASCTTSWRTTSPWSTCRPVSPTTCSTPSPPRRMRP